MTILKALNWQTTAHTGSTSKSDVTISLHAPSEGKRKARFCITFRNHAHCLICPNIEKVSYGVGLGIIAFQESNDGWKLSKAQHTKDGTVYVQITADASAEKSLMNMIGNYDLEEENGVYFVSKYGKKEV